MARSRWSSPRTRSGWASTRLMCGPSVTRACRARWRPTTRRRGARAATARRRARCCSPRAATRGCTRSSSSARAWTTRCWRGWPGACRRGRFLRNFGDGAPPAAGDGVACCDVCAPEVVPAAPERRALPGRVRAGAPEQLDDAILAVVAQAQPAVGRTRAVEILRGGRSRVVLDNRYDELALHGAFAHLRSDDVLGRVDELVTEGRLRSTGGEVPQLPDGRETPAA